jgi:type 1 fimbriae regulatory protein FimB/type 1 fimbriae regulatory protein FimE
LLERQPSKTGKLCGQDLCVPQGTFPKRHKYTDVRSQEYLTPAEVDRLRQTARRGGRHGLRNATMMLLAYHHGLRVLERINLRWEQLDLDQGFFHVRRLTHGVPSTHP